jgi:hypothetical protein
MRENLPPLPTDGLFRDLLEQLIERSVRLSTGGEGRAIAAALRVLRADPALRTALVGMPPCDQCHGTGQVPISGHNHGALCGYDTVTGCTACATTGAGRSAQPPPTAP